MKIRIVLTLITLVLWALLSFALSVSAPLVSSALAVRQFDDSNTGYVISRFADWFTGAGPSSLILVAVLAAIWWRPLVTFVTTIALASLLFASSAQAYYDKSDYSEAYFILPNESAFFIPDVGANKEGQAKFGSQDYYEQNKIPAKRFVIPHAKFSGSGMWSDFYVPTGRLIIVDRTPYNREWTASQHRGSSARDESFPCQSSEGLNITVEMAVSATVSEENAARFLYHFGVKAPQGDRSKPEVIFTSVFYGRSLPEVMDSVGRGEVQTLACAELSTRTLDQNDLQMAAILAAIQGKAKAWFADYGITIDYLGWAGTFTFDPEVQKAINDRYSADKIAPVLSTVQAQADVKIKEGLGLGLANHGLPSSFVAIPTNLLEDFSALFKPSPSK